MKKSALSIAAMAFVIGCTGGVTSPAKADGTHNGNGQPLLLGQLTADCRRGGGPAFADFENIHSHGHRRQVLRLAAQTSTAVNNANGEASAFVLNLNGIQFHNNDVTLSGDCFINQAALFEIFVKFIPPGSSVEQGLSFACDAMEVPGHPGQLSLTPSTVARDGVSHIPFGSTLTEVHINEQSGDPNVGLITVFIYSVTINQTPVGFDHTAVAASCPTAKIPLERFGRASTAPKLSSTSLN